MRKKITDGINFLSKLTFSKSLNAVQILGSFYFSKITKQVRHRGMPISISIEPTTSCNLRCPECPSGKREFTRPTGMLEKNFFKKVLDELENNLLYLIFYFQGEPYLNPQFLDMVKYASEKKIYTATSTNAHYLNSENAKKTIESGLDRLIISIDGTTQETYEQYRIGGNLEKVIEGTKNIVAWKKKLHSKTPFIIFQFLVVKPNEHQIEDVKKLAKNLGVDDVRFKTAQIYNYENGHDLIPETEKYSRYKKQKNNTYILKNKMRDECWKLWHSSVITWDGKVAPCCFDKDVKHAMGTVSEKTFSEVWKNEAYQNFRESVFRSRSEIDICKNCTEGTKVWA
ncbi:MAG: radical SAM/SPASM domain-containing protein [Bacteroidia bacterium]